jgi:hypothetical protein
MSIGALAASPGVVFDISDHQTCLRRLYLAAQLWLYLQRRALRASEYRAGLRPATKCWRAVACLSSAILAQLLAGAPDPFSLTQRYRIVELKLKDWLLGLPGLDITKRGNHGISLAFKVPSSECRAMPP